MGKFVIKETKTGIKFDLKATNGQVIASSQVYASVASCKKGIASVAKNAPIAAVEDQTVENYAAEKNYKGNIKVFAINDKYVKQGKKEEVIKKLKLDTDTISKKILDNIVKSDV